MSNDMSTEDIYGEIKKMVDEAIAEISNRELVSSTEMTNLLLDLRLMMMSDEGSVST